MRSLQLGIVSLLLIGASNAGEDLVPVRFKVADKAGHLIPCRIHLTNGKGEAMRAGSLPFFRDHFSCGGEAELRVPPGKYAYAIERGPEFTRCKASFEAAPGAAVEISRELGRMADLFEEGWASGDLHVHRPVDDMELLMKAEDLHVAPTITWWNKTNPWKASPSPERPLVRFDGDRYYHLLGGEDERQGGAFLYYNLERPIDITGAEKEFPSPLKFLEEARARPGAWIDIEKPFWWDVPVALAHGFGDSIGIANNHMWRSGMLENEAWGRPRDRERYPPPLGLGPYCQEIYHHILNSGIRIPPSAGSASGVLPNPVGYDRVYVKFEGPFTHEGFWEGLRKGRCFVTNGPLLRVEVEGRPPGHVFAAGKGEALELEVRARLSGNDPAPSVEIVVNGAVERSMPAAELERSGSLGKVRFDRSGWFLVRTIADVKETYRFASTGPYYVEIGEEKRRLSRDSIRYFLGWVEERMAQVKIDDPEKRREVLRYHDAAKRFWEERLRSANAE